MADLMQGTGAAAQQASAAQQAQAAGLDAQLELEAKKAALRGLQEANAEGGPATALAPAVQRDARTTITVEKDGKVIQLENPTDAQLAQLGIGERGSEWNLLGRLEPSQVMGLSVFALMATVGITWLLLHYLRGGRSMAPSAPSTELNARMARIENAVESVAVEVERISEGQRFTSRMLSEGAAQPVTHAAAGDRAVPQNSRR
jgi:hypothetical protein